MTECSAQLCLGFHPRLAVRLTFDAPEVCSDGGVVLLRQVDDRLGLTAGFARCLPDARDATRVVHDRPEQSRQRIYQIALGYEDCNHADRLRSEPLLKTVCDRTPDDPVGLSSQPTPVALRERSGWVDPQAPSAVAGAQLRGGFVRRHRGGDPRHRRHRRRDARRAAAFFLPRLFRPPHLPPSDGLRRRQRATDQRHPAAGQHPRQPGRLVAETVHENDGTGGAGAISPRGGGGHLAPAGLGRAGTVAGRSLRRRCCGHEILLGVTCVTSFRKSGGGRRGEVHPGTCACCEKPAAHGSPSGPPPWIEGRGALHRGTASQAASRAPQADKRAEETSACLASPRRRKEVRHAIETGHIGIPASPSAGASHRSVSGSRSSSQVPCVSSGARPGGRRRWALIVPIRPAGSRTLHLRDLAGGPLGGDALDLAIYFSTGGHCARIRSRPLGTVTTDAAGSASIPDGDFVMGSTTPSTASAARGLSSFLRPLGGHQRPSTARGHGDPAAAAGRPPGHPTARHTSTSTPIRRSASRASSAVWISTGIGLSGSSPEVTSTRRPQRFGCLRSR